MNKYKVSDYQIFEDAKESTNVCKKNIEEVQKKINESNDKLKAGDIFEGPICEAYTHKLEVVSNKLNTLMKNCDEIINFMGKTSESYQLADNKASSDVKLENGAEEPKEYRLQLKNKRLVTTEYTGVNTGNTNRDEVYNLLSEAGYNNAAICGILGNIEHESNFNTEAVGDYGASHGLCQWNDNYGRWTDVKNYCKENGLDPNSVEGQVKFMIDDMKKYDLDSYMKNVPNTPEGAAAAADKWTRVYERPADIDNQAASRGNKAQYTYFDLYGNQ